MLEGGRYLLASVGDKHVQIRLIGSWSWWHPLSEAHTGSNNLHTGNEAKQNDAPWSLRGSTSKIWKRYYLLLPSPLNLNIKTFWNLGSVQTVVYFCVFLSETGLQRPDFEHYFAESLHWSVGGARVCKKTHKNHDVHFFGTGSKKANSPYRNVLLVFSYGDIGGHGGLSVCWTVLVSTVRRVQSVTYNTRNNSACFRANKRRFARDRDIQNVAMREYTLQQETLKAQSTHTRFEHPVGF